MVRFDLEHPTERQLRAGVTCGLIAEAIIIPLMISVSVVDHHPLRWGYIGAAVACLIVSIVYLSLFVVITKGRSNVQTQANMWFVIVCLAISGLACIEVATSTANGLYTPAMLIGVVFVCIIGDRHMQIVVDLYVIALIALINWVEGMRGAGLVTTLSVYAATIGVITLICVRTVSSIDGHVSFRQAIDDLNEVFAEFGLDGTGPGADTLQEVFRRGLPLVGNIIPAERIAVFLRDGTLEQLVVVAAWPAEHGDVSELARLPLFNEALMSNSPTLDTLHCVIPVGYSTDGELVMVVERSTGDGSVPHRPTEEADLLATVFLRVTSRANFVDGFRSESRTDPLTGLANRRCLFERIETEMAHALRSETPLSVAMIDLDHFSEYNDRFGQVAGDTVLRSIAAVMVSNVRRQDMVARYGGEEFCLVMPETDLVGGHHLLDILRTGGRVATSSYGVTLSAGLTSWDGMEDTVTFIERAGQALFRAKESGRNRVVSIQTFTEP